MGAGLMDVGMLHYGPAVAKKKISSKTSQNVLHFSSSSSRRAESEHHAAPAEGPEAVRSGAPTSRRATSCSFFVSGSRGGTGPLLSSPRSARPNVVDSKLSVVPGRPGAAGGGRRRGARLPAAVWRAEGGTTHYIH